MSVFGIVPAKRRSTGIPGKNWTPLAGRTPAMRAIQCGLDAGCERVIVSVDGVQSAPFPEDTRAVWLERPPALAQDDTPMIDVVKHALAFSTLLIARNPVWTGRENPDTEDIFVLLQPTQPLRTPAHVKAAIALLESSGADSVVSVVELPRTHHPEFVLQVKADGQLDPWLPGLDIDCQPATRQAVDRVYIRDGTCYAFRRRNVRYGIYGQDVRPLIIPASETCALDTPADWADAERRLQA